MMQQQYFHYRSSDEKEHEAAEDRTPPLAHLTQYLTITYKHCRQQQEDDTKNAECMTVLQQQLNGGGEEKATERVTTASSVSSRRVLTKKSEPAGNGGLDNEDRNLIVRVRDVLGCDDKTTSSYSKVAGKVPPRYVVLDLLGQGTFGQVFRCQHAATKDVVAVKVIRNHASYYKQAIVEVQVTRMLHALLVSSLVQLNQRYRSQDSRHLVRLLNTFEFRNHLCLVFELLSMNVYELIAENNFHGFPLDVTRGFLRQILYALTQLGDAGVIHCDLKPENILLAGPDQFYEEPMSTRLFRSNASDRSPTIPLLKIVDFGSACLENETVYSYIQSRFYRSPEVLLGIPYNGAIDMWSLGCIAFEMLLGLPLFPGVSEHDQLHLIEKTLGELPQYLLKKGRNVLKFFDVRIRHSAAGFGGSEAFVLKTPQQFAKESKSEVRVSKKYFKHSKLEDMINAYPFREGATPDELNYERERRQAFLHLLSGLLTVDPAARWTAKEALHHPFITGERFLAEYTHPAYRLDDEVSSLRNGSPVYSYHQQADFQNSAVQSEMAYQQSIAPTHQRVCPMNSYYCDPSDPFFTGPGNVRYELPWFPPFPAPSIGHASYNYTYQQAPYDQNQFQPLQQPIFCWSMPPPCETFDPPVPPLNAASTQRMKQKVAPVSARSVVMPMHSPSYNFPHVEFPYQHYPNTYDPGIPHALDRQHALSIASADQQFRTPPKPHQQANHKAAFRVTRRRRSTQPRIPDTGLALPTFDSSSYVTSQAGSHSRQSQPVKAKNSGHHHHRHQQQQQKSKRRSEHKNGSNEFESRSWKSPRSSTGPSIGSVSRRGPTNQGFASTTESSSTTQIGRLVPSGITHRSEDLHVCSIEGKFSSTAMGNGMAPPAPTSANIICGIASKIH